MRHKNPLDIEATDRAVYQAVRNHLRAGEKPTIGLIAEELGISSSAVYRAAKRYGYASWSDMVGQLGQYLKNNRRVVEHTGDDANGIDLLAQAFMRHRGGRVLLQGTGDADICRRLLVYRLGALEFTAMPYTPQIARACLEQSEDGNAGLALIFHESGLACWQDALECVQCGFETVAVTADANTPVARASNLAIAIKSNKSALSAYEPNYFAAGSLALVERALERFIYLMERESLSALS